MDKKLLDKYPLAKRAFAAQDTFYKDLGEPMPAENAGLRERVAVILDKYLDSSTKEKDAMLVTAIVAIDPIASHDIYGDASYPGVEDLLKTLIKAVKENPTGALPHSVAPLITAIAIAKMEQTTEKARNGTLKVTPEAVKGSLKRGAINDGVYLPNLHSKDLQDLYETTQFAYFAALENAAKPVKKPPVPPNPGGPVF
jgi:hypothetical protein